MKTKLEILKRIDDGTQRKEIAQNYGISQSTLSDMVKKKAELRAFVAGNPSNMKTKRRTNVKDHRLVETSNFRSFFT